MICRVSKRMIELDGEIGPRQQRRLQKHLQRCAACRREREGRMAFKRAVEELRQRPADIAAPAFLTNQILTAVSRESVAARRRHSAASPLRRLAPIPAGALLLLLNLWVLQQAYVGYRLWRLEQHAAQEPPPLSLIEQVRQEPEQLMKPLVTESRSLPANHLKESATWPRSWLDVVEKQQELSEKLRRINLTPMQIRRIYRSLPQWAVGFDPTLQALIHKQRGEQ